MLFPCKWTHLLSLVDCVVRVEWYFRLNLKLSVSRLSGSVWEMQNVTGHICPVIIHHSKGYFLKGRHLYRHNYQPYLCCLWSFSQVYSNLCLFLLFVHLQFLSFFYRHHWHDVFFFHFKGHYPHPTWCLSELILAQIYAFERHNCHRFSKQGLCCKGLLMQLRKPTRSGVKVPVWAKGVQVESPLFFKSTESQRRSVLNCYFRFFKLRED